MGCINSAFVAGHADSGDKTNAKANASSRKNSHDEVSLAKIDFEMDEKDSNLTGSKKTLSMKFGNFNISYAVLSQRGYYPESPNKANQDAFTVVTNLFGDSHQALFAVFDGHGKDGDKCARFCKKQVPVNAGKFLKGCDHAQVNDALTKLLVTTNTELHKSKIDDSLSGTTAVVVYMNEENIYIANVGDSRAIIGSLNEDGEMVAKALSNDHTPYRKDERERVKACGARVMSMDQIEGFEPVHENWGDITLGEEIDEAGDPPRVWSQHGEYPGTAFTRSIGDAVAKDLGVCPEPEIVYRKISAGDKYIIIASDGVFEFITNQAVIDMVQKHNDPQVACSKIVKEAYDLWLQYEVRTDDITMICIRIEEVTSLGKRDSVTSPRGIIKQARRKYSREKKKQLISAARAEAGTVDLSKYNFPKPKAEQDRIMQAIGTCFLFENITLKQKALLVEAMEIVVVKPGDVLIRQGDEGDKFYIIDSGKFEVRINAHEDEIKAGDFGPVVHMYESDGKTHPSFGELALMYSKPRGATVVAVVKGRLWALARPVFKFILTQQSSTRDLLHTLRRVHVLASLTLKQLDALAQVVQEVNFVKGQTIITKGDLGDCMYIIQDGSLCVLKPNDKGQNVTVATLSQYQYFGEQALLTNQPRNATIIADTACTLLRIDTQAFENVLGPLQTIIDDHARRRELVDQKGNDAAIPNFYQLQRFGILSTDDIGVLQMCSFFAPSTTPTPGKDGTDTGFFPTSPIGSKEEGAGFFGNLAKSLTKAPPVPVMQKEKSTRLKRRTYTLRTMWKKEISERNQTEMVMRGKSLALELRRTARESQESCILVPLLLETFKDTNFLHLLFGVTIACDMHSVVVDGQLTNESIQHSAACIVLGLDFIHQTGIKYRAIATDLLYLDQNGFTILMEYRFAKAGLSEKSSTICGDPEYLPPEVIRNEGSGIARDFWCLGVYIYETFCGQTPFVAKREIDTYSSITNFRPSNLETPKDMPATLRQLLEQLLNPDPEQRLGCTSSGITALKTHKWFAEINWERLANGTQTNETLLAIAQQKTQDAANKSDSVSSVDKIFVGEDSIFEGF